AVAGDVWLGDGSRVTLTETVVVGRNTLRLYPEPSRHTRTIGDRYDRQVRLFGDRGQAVLGKAKVGVIGAGGVGSLVVEYLARLGVGTLVVIDPDRVDVTNLSRVVDATNRDALSCLSRADRPGWLRRIGRRFARHKVDIARRVARRASP